MIDEFAELRELEVEDSGSLLEWPLRHCWTVQTPFFISKADPTERLYFDIVSVARDGDGWTLKSGLCKR